jgi:hypothetical protein
MIVKEIFFHNKGKVSISDDGMSFKEFKDLYAADKDSHKKYFKEVIKGIFFLYSLNSPIPVTGMEHEEKVNLMNTQWMNKDWRKLSKSPKVQACVKLYKRLVFKKDRDLIMQVLEDMDDFMKHLHNIPSQKKIKIKYKRKTKDGEEETVDGYDTIYNFDEKIKAYNDFEKLQKLYENLEEKLKMEHKAIIRKQKIFEAEKEAPPDDVMTYSHIKTDKS